LDDFAVAFSLVNGVSQTAKTHQFDDTRFSEGMKCSIPLSCPCVIKVSSALSSAGKVSVVPANECNAGISHSHSVFATVWWKLRFSMWSSRNRFDLEQPKERVGNSSFHLRRYRQKVMLNRSSIFDHVSSMKSSPEQILESLRQTRLGDLTSSVSQMYSRIIISRGNLWRPSAHVFWVIGETADVTDSMIASSAASRDDFISPLMFWTMKLSIPLPSERGAPKSAAIARFAANISVNQPNRKPDLSNRV
jgi:hypothetical protein